MAGLQHTKHSCTGALTLPSMSPSVGLCHHLHDLALSADLCPCRLACHPFALLCFSLLALALASLATFFPLIHDPVGFHGNRNIFVHFLTQHPGVIPFQCGAVILDDGLSQPAVVLGLRHIELQPGLRLPSHEDRDLDGVVEFHACSFVFPKLRV